MTTGFGSSEFAHSPGERDFDRMTPEQRTAWDNAYQLRNDSFRKDGLSGKDLAIWKGQQYLQDYLATIAAVDESVGRVLDFLEESWLNVNTLVVYTSDQGFYLGEKRWFDKRFMYEESLRMPLPGVIQPGSTIDAMVQNLDLAGGSEFTDGMQGKSFKGLLYGSIDPENFRDAVYYHYIMISLPFIWSKNIMELGPKDIN